MDDKSPLNMHSIELRFALFSCFSKSCLLIDNLESNFTPTVLSLYLRTMSTWTVDFAMLSDVDLGLAMKQV